MNELRIQTYQRILYQRNRRSKFRKTRNKVRIKSWQWPPPFVYAGPSSLESVVQACTARTLLLHFLSEAAKFPTIFNRLDLVEYAAILKRSDSSARKAQNEFNTMFKVQNSVGIYYEEFHFVFDPLELQMHENVVKFGESFDREQFGLLKRGYCDICIAKYHFLLTS